MKNIEIIDQDLDPLPNWLSKVKAFVQSTLLLLEYRNYDCTILFCQANFIRDLNKKYRHKDSPTDVLSFDSRDLDLSPSHSKNIKYDIFGDIVVSLDGLRSNCQAFNVTADTELKRLIIHGILHLNGWRHDEESPAGEMLDFQEELLQVLKNEEPIIQNEIY